MRSPHRTTIALVSGASVLAALAACSDAPRTSAAVIEPAATGSRYADGTYTETSSYQTLNAKQSMGVSVTLKGGRITAVEVTPEANNPTSAQYQTTFASAIARVVVGKPIDQANVDVVSGSSITSRGFNAALARIASDARA